ncbi:Phosphoenolpyruvate carboxykinase (GTP) [Aciduliprofundum boonei T469]|uniref:Phosphoenolpyruvate carboxykinase [GTP] n=2 Tax=Candidatus Aciduliprofundum boonei TaxID=379547 RepID=D3T9B7_ACIB4|nr:Phosphoenolpyruvate carboxykinase (GTP) [Aciduliprofundum boonei T469]
MPLRKVIKMNDLEYLKSVMDEEQYEKLEKIDNPELHHFLAEHIKLLKPSKIFVANDSDEDELYIRNRAIVYEEERLLKTPGHTVHFDNYYDQARDKEHTYILTPHGEKLPYLNTMKRDDGLKEVLEIMDGIMQGKELFILFFSLGPKNSEFMVPSVQLTDSAYVAHSEFILYRKAYDVFTQNPNLEFFKFVHSEGELDERKTSKNLDKRRIMIDLEGNITYAVNTQYAGNTIGLKKPAFRLTINKAVKEGWLSEHMFLMGVNGPNGRVTYFTGAFPSMCGKTSTCMLIGERLVGDDLSFIRDINGEARAVNVEYGVFGIIQGVNKEDDPYIWQVLHTPQEIIFSNILVHEGKPYWNDMGEEIPCKGENHSGKWWCGKKDKEGNEIPPSHKNARFTARLIYFPNLDREALDSKDGVKLSGMIFGGRDSDTWPPVCESFNWQHGVIMKGASIESETTAATLGKEGVRKFNIMSILDFMSVHLGVYIENYLKFGRKLKTPPKIFAVNYFLKDENGNYLNSKLDKKVWLKWMDLRVHNEVDAIETPIGYIPYYEDLARLFKEVFNREYKKEDYEKQFTIRVPNLLAKIERIRKIYGSMDNIPKELYEELDAEEKRLKDAQKKYGDFISPFQFIS